MECDINIEERFAFSSSACTGERAKSNREVDVSMLTLTRTILLVLTIAMVSTFSSHPFPLLHKKRVTLQCLNDVMLLAMDLQDIPAIKPSSLHLQLFACQPHHVTETSAFFRVPFEGCGTTRGTTRRKMHGRIHNYITFSNLVENSLPLNNSRVIVSHTPKLHYPFSCYYRQKYVITIQEGNENRTGHQQGLKQRREGPESRFLRNELSSCGQTNCYITFLLAEIMLFVIVSG